MMTATKVAGLKTISPIPRSGEKQLSINAAVADVGKVWSIAKEFGFSPELVQMQWKSETEIHILFWRGTIADAPDSLEEAFDTLSDQCDCSAIHYASKPEKVIA